MEKDHFGTILLSSLCFHFTKKIDISYYTTVVAHVLYVNIIKFWIVFIHHFYKWILGVFWVAQLFPYKYSCCKIASQNAIISYRYSNKQKVKRNDAYNFNWKGNQKEIITFISFFFYLPLLIIYKQPFLTCSERT